jgi:hypothetical protein
MDDQTVYMLTKTFSNFSAGTQFRIKDVTGGTIAHCLTAYPIKLDKNDTPDYIRADIPLKYLTPKRKREHAEV